MSQLADNDADYVLVFDGVNGLRMAPRGAAEALESQDSGRLSVSPPSLAAQQDEAIAHRGAGRAMVVIGAVIALGVVGFTVGRWLTESSATPVAGVAKPAARSVGTILGATPPLSPAAVAAPRRARAVAIAHRPSAARPVVARKPEPAATSCRAGGWTDRLVCHDPALAAQDVRLGSALKAAAQAGVPAADLQDGQFAWLAARNAAARRSKAEVAAAYRRRIEEVESLANETPPY